MIKKNFFLTDLMKLGDHAVFEQFIQSNTLTDQEFTFTSDYYRLHTFDFTKYGKKFAIINHNISNNEIWKNPEYLHDVHNRIETLHRHGFFFIIGHPWESEQNVSNWYNYKNLCKGKKFVSWSGGTSWFWYLMYKKHENKKYKFNHINKKFDFLYLNKQSRQHRKKLFDLMQKQNLLENSLFSFLDKPYVLRLNSNYELPWTTIDIHKKDRYYYKYDQDIYEPQFNDSAFNLVSETNDNNHDVFITEKLWKPIIAQQIFVVHGNYGYLKKLREMGFRTFDSVFDESYDQELDPNKRIEKIVSLCRHLRTVDKATIYRETESIRQHNYSKFFDKTALSDAVNETVLGFLKLVDRS
jgi:hypothetical protein